MTGSDDWLDTVATILAAKTHSLRELARLANADPITFYEYTSSHELDLNDQDLSGMVFKGATESLSFKPVPDFVVANPSDTSLQAVEDSIAELQKWEKEGFRLASPEAWSNLTYRIGSRLFTLGKSRHHESLLERSIDYFNLSLEERHVGQGEAWARVVYRIGLCLYTLGIQNDTELDLMAAIQTLEDALKKPRSLGGGDLREMIMISLGRTHLALGSLNADTAEYMQAIELLSSIKHAFQDAHQKTYLGGLLASIGEAYLGVYQTNSDTSALELAIENLDTAASKILQANISRNGAWSTLKSKLGICYMAIHDYKHAADAFSAALSARATTSKSRRIDWEYVEEQLADAQQKLAAYPSRT